MHVYCTCPLEKAESPHVTELPDLPQDAIALEQWQQQVQPCEKCGMPLILGNGRYVPIAILGKGGFGCVFLAYDLKFPQSDRTYALRAIKQFRSDRGLLPGQAQIAFEAFKQEVAVLDQLHHPQIPRVYEPFQVRSGDHHYAYFVQEYVPGSNLQQLLQASPRRLWDEASVREMLHQVLEILHYLQTRSQPVLHRDIKPSNIIKAKDGKYYLIDFGSVRQVVADTVSTLAGQETKIVYTPGYAPDEQLQGKVGWTSDLYALAKTCICLLTGKPEGELSHRIVTPPFKRLLAQMIAPDPAKRPASASVVLKQLTAPPRRSLRYALLASCAIAPMIAYGVYQYHVHQPSPIPLSQRETDQPSPMPLPQRDWENSPSTIAEVSDPPLAKDYFYGGSTTAKPLADAINQWTPPGNPKLTLNRKPRSDGKLEHSEEGIDRLIQGELDFALSSKDLPTQQKQNAKKRGTKLTTISVARTIDAVIVHPTLQIDGITNDEFDKILSRKIVDWKELGHPANLKITIYATNSNYIRNTSAKPQAGIDFQQIKGADEGFKMIQGDPGGLYIAPTPVVVQSKEGCSLKALKLGKSEFNLIHPFSAKQCEAGEKNQVNLKAIDNSSYPLRPFISVIVLQDKGEKQLVGEYYAYLLTTEEAREKMKEHGYVPIPPKIQ